MYTRFDAADQALCVAEQVMDSVTQRRYKICMTSTVCSDFRKLYSFAPYDPATS